MSHRDALRSYRRAWKRGWRTWKYRTHPLTVEICRRGDRLRMVFGHLGTDELPMEVIDALTTRDLRELKRMDKEDCDACPF